MRPFCQFFFLALVVAFPILAAAGILRQEMSAMNWLFAGLVPVSLLLFGIWYLVFGKARPGRRFRNFGLGTAIYLLLSGAFVALFRYEGSASGSSFPKFAPRWTESAWDRPTETGLVETGRLEVPAEISGAFGENLGFLGPEGDGMWKKTPFSTNWSDSPPELLWRRKTGFGWSGFAVSDGKAVTQEQVDETERVVCLDLATGAELWHHDNKGVRLLNLRGENAGVRMGGDGPRSTPAIHEGRIIAAGATGIVDCLSLEDGSLLWSRNIIQEFGGKTHEWGIANSPLILAELGIVVVAGTDSVVGDTGVSFAALDLETGQDEWTWRGEGASYATPRLARLGGEEHLVIIGRARVVGLDPETGIERWSHPWPGLYPKVGQPQVVGEDRLLVSASYGAGTRLLRISRSGGSWSAEEVWNSNRLKTKFSTAVLVNGFAVGLDEGRLAAIGLEDGRIAWKGPKFGFGQNLLFGDHLLVQTEPGGVVVGRVGPEGFEETGSLAALDAMSWSAPTVAGRILLVRSENEAACYLLPAP